MVFKKFWEYVEKSILAGISNKVSTTRISSYLILGSILTTGIVYLLIDIVNAIIKWSKGQVFIISTEDLIFFGMILAHHLALLGINKNAETKQYMDLLKSAKDNKDSVGVNNIQKQQSAPQNSDSTETTDPQISEGTGREEDSI
jgi:hypothetical protein